MKVKARKGDSLSYYASLFRIPVELLVDSNPQLDPDHLEADEMVEVPGFIKETCVVREGDTLWGLSGERNIGVDALLLINENSDPNEVETGVELFLPRRVVTPVVNGKQPYDSVRFQKDLILLQELYPFIRVNAIGKSVLGKDLMECKIGRGAKKVHMNGAFHGNEWITSAVLMTFLNDYLLSLTNSKDLRGIPILPLYRTVSLSLVPMVNPDGVDLVLNGPPDGMAEELVRLNGGRVEFTGWKANIRGIDLNKQFPARWEFEKRRMEVSTPGPRDFTGNLPISEPESKAMEQLARKERFHRLVAVHTQGKEFYWGYEGLESKESERLAGEIKRASGYASIRYVDSYAGFKDWFIQEFQQTGITLELGKGINPLPLSQFDTIYRDTLGIYLIMLYKWW